MKTLEKLTRSSQLSKVSEKYNLNGKVVEVTKHMTATEQFNAGMTDKKEGTQVIYEFTVDGKLMKLKGATFSKWCRENGIEVVGKTASNEDKTPKSFKPSKNAEFATNDELKQEIERLKGILHAREEAEKAKVERERRRNEALAKLSKEERELLGL